MTTYIMRKLLSIMISIMVVFVPKDKYQRELDAIPSIEQRIAGRDLKGWEPRWCTSENTFEKHVYFYYPSQRVNASTLVCLHGFNTDGSIFFNLSQLADTYQIIAYNFPDRSARYQGSISDFNAVLDDFFECMQLDTVVLLGNSVGGGLAVYYAANGSRAVVSDLVLTSTNIFGTTETSVRQIKGMADKLLEYPDYKLYYLLKKGENILSRLEGSALLKSTPQETVAIKHVAWYRQVLSSLYDYNGTADAQKIQCPVLVFHGNEDSMLPLESAKNIPHLITHADFNIIKGGGHSIVYYNADQIAPHLRILAR